MGDIWPIDASSVWETFPRRLDIGGGMRNEAWCWDDFMDVRLLWMLEVLIGDDLTPGGLFHHTMTAEWRQREREAWKFDSWWGTGWRREGQVLIGIVIFFANISVFLNELLETAYQTVVKQIKSLRWNSSLFVFVFYWNLLTRREI